MLGQLNRYLKKENWIHILHNIRINTKWTEDLKRKHEVNMIQKNVAKFLYKLNVGKHLPSWDSKSRSNKRKRKSQLYEKFQKSKPKYNSALKKIKRHV